MEIEFTWRPEKAKSNLKKHGISFETPIQVFTDPFRFILDDCEDEAGELRLHAIGHAGSQLLVLLVFIDRSEDGQDVFHIISARKANSYEEQFYAQQFS